VKSYRFAVVIFLCIGICTIADAETVQPSLLYDGAAFDDISGGLRRGTTYLGTLRLRLTLDPPRTSAFIEVLNAHGGSPSDFAGDAQGVSSLAAPHQWRIEEAWLQQNFLGAQLSVLAGRYDLNSEFYRLQSAGLFLNSSFGVGPEFSQSGARGPSIYPNTSTALRVNYRPVNSVVMRAAAFDGLVLGEIDYLLRPSASGMPRDVRSRLGRLAGLPPYKAKLSIGAWRYTNSAGSSGVYLLGDRTIYENGARQVAAFGQLGIGDARANRFARYFGSGVVVNAPFANRSQDQLGFALASARSGSSGETTLECTYLTPVTPHIAVQPDIQYVVHPSADRSTKNALVAFLRFEISR